jgi:hypothetical protein
MTRSEAAVGGTAPETKGGAVRATAAAGLHRSLGAAGAATRRISRPRRFQGESFAVQCLSSRGFVSILKILNSVFLDWDCRVASVSL